MILKNFTLPKSLAAWTSDEFKSVFKQEVALLDEYRLPLQQALSNSNLADGSDISVLILNSFDAGQSITVKTALFYHGFVSGCNCSDDPSPMESTNEYCELMLSINKQTAETSVELLPTD